MEPSKVASMATECSDSSTTTRSLRSGSSTSTRIGPTERSARSTSGFDERTMCCLSPMRTSMKASVVPRLGYWPRPKMANRSWLSGYMLK